MLSSEHLALLKLSYSLNCLLVTPLSICLERKHRESMDSACLLHSHVTCAWSLCQEQSVFHKPLLTNTRRLSSVPSHVGQSTRSRRQKSRPLQGAGSVSELLAAPAELRQRRQTMPSGGPICPQSSGGPSMEVTAKEVRNHERMRDPAWRLDQLGDDKHGACNSLYAPKCF